MHLLSLILLFFALEASATPLPNLKPLKPRQPRPSGDLNDFVVPSPELYEWFGLYNKAETACQYLWNPALTNSLNSRAWNKCVEDYVAQRYHPSPNSTSKSKSSIRSIRAHPNSLDSRRMIGHYNNSADIPLDISPNLKLLKPRQPRPPGDLNDYVPPSLEQIEWARLLNEAHIACEKLWDPAAPTFFDISPSYFKCSDDYLAQHRGTNSTSKSKSATRSIRTHPNSLNPREVGCCNSTDNFVFRDGGHLSDQPFSPKVYQAFLSASRACEKLKDPGEAWLAEHSPYNNCFNDYMDQALLPKGETH